MPKLKTHKGAKKRFKITGTGKVKVNHEGKGHILTKKSSKRKRRLRNASILSPSAAKKVKGLLPYGRS
ncbi:50S ribosomal protein L35 [bacterium]|nr:50S ribosomal protein L35 [bacterium]MCK5398743.1 50S ribosomal protein L35 [bacterium]